jgi:DNA-binding MarR family transcriptional regulator
LTAPHYQADKATAVGRTCEIAADGRRAVRALAKWCDSFDLSEPEFQVLWILRVEKRGFDQTSLARQLAYSPAQVSATVERLRNRGWIAQEPAANDRRRNLWRLTAAGSDVIVQMLSAAIRLHGQSAEPPREAAA